MKIPVLIYVLGNTSIIKNNQFSSNKYVNIKKDAKNTKEFIITLCIIIIWTIYLLVIDFVGVLGISPPTREYFFFFLWYWGLNSWNTP
jgi:hypothetical protein